MINELNGDWKSFIAVATQRSIHGSSHDAEFSSLEYDKLLDIEDDFIHKLYDEFEEESVDKIIIFIEG